MVDLSTLEKALRNADAAGDEPAARRLAHEIQKLRAAGPDQSYKGAILPFSKDAQGNVSFDSDAGIVGGLKRAFTLPGDVYTGKTQLRDETGEISPEVLGRSMEFAATFSPATPGLRSGDRLIPGQSRAVKRQKVEPPTSQQLYDEAGMNYKAMRDSGVDYDPNSVKSAAEAIKRSLEQEGFDAEVAGKTHRILDKLASPPEGSVAEIKGLHSARKTFGKIAQNFNDPSDQSAASRAIRGMDEFIGDGAPENVLAGTASDAANALKSGNANFAAAKRSDMLTGVERAADLRAAASNSGANTGNSIRQRLASVLLDPKKTSGFNQGEVSALEGIVQGSTAQNATRRLGNMLGGGGGMGQMLTTAVGGATGGAVGGPAGAAAGAMIPLALGTGSKELSNILTSRALSQADKLVRTRSPLYERMVNEAPMVAISPEKRAALVRLLMLSEGARD